MNKLQIEDLETCLDCGNLQTPQSMAKSGLCIDCANIKFNWGKVGKESSPITDNKTIACMICDDIFTVNVSADGVIKINHRCI